jgi:hypothetical protein
VKVSQANDWHIVVSIRCIEIPKAEEVVGHRDLRARATTHGFRLEKPLNRSRGVNDLPNVSILEPKCQRRRSIEETGHDSSVFDGQMWEACNTGIEIPVRMFQ